MSTGWIWHEAFNWHNTGNGSGFFPPGGHIQPHELFDSPATKGRFAALVEVSGLRKHLVALDPEPATDEEILRVHSPEYLRRLKAMDETGGDAGEMAPFGPKTLNIIKLAAGAVCTGLKNVLDGTVNNAYALVRPAGHHAEVGRGRGYCVLANVAIATRMAKEVYGVERVALVDWDVHHGNGAQGIFWDDPSVLTLSLHQDRLYPVDTGRLDENGGANALGTALNIPLPAGTGDGGYVQAMERVVLPALDRFRPELIIVSSGLDPAAVDPLGRMVVTSQGFRSMTRMVTDAAANLTDGKVFFAHEGGYSAHYVPFCGMAILEELTGVDSGVEDPYWQFFQHYPAAETRPWEAAAIAEAAELVSNVPRPK